MKFIVLLPALAGLPFNASFGGELGYCLTATTALHNTAIDGCTANESAVSAVSIKQISDPCISTSDTGTIQLTANLDGANTNRYDIGIYLNVVGGSALSDTANGDCFNEFLDPTSASATECELDGFGDFFDGDSGDDCGDIRKSTAQCTAEATALNAVVALTEVGTTETYEDIDVACADNGPSGAADGYLDLDACSAYHQNVTDADACSAGLSDFTELFQGTSSFTTGAGVPGTSSKCNCTDAVNAIPPTPIPDLALSCSCDTVSTNDSGFAVRCYATVDNNATLRASVTGVDATEPGAASEYDFDLISSGPGTRLIEPESDSSGATLPGNGASVVWKPQGGQVTGTSSGVIGAGDDAILTFVYSGDTEGSHAISLDANWTNGTDSVADVLTAPAPGCSFDVTFTYASIDRVSAEANGKQVELSWETSTEIGTVGYDVYRLNPLNGEYVKANQDLLPASQNTSGGFYRFVDRGAAPGSQMSYKILEQTTGLNRWHGPYDVTPGSGRQSPARSLQTQSRAGKSLVDLDHYQVREKVWKSSRAEKNSIKKLPVAAAGGNKLNKLPVVAAGKISPVKFPVVATGVTGEQIRIEVSSDGFYSLTAADIATRLGTSVKKAEWAIRKGKYTLSNRGNAVDWEKLDNNSGIRFYGAANQSIYSDSNVYWLSPGQGGLMSTANGSASAPAPAGLTFASTAHLEQDVEPRYYIAEDPLDDYWYWLVTAPGWAGEASGLETPGAAASGEAELTVELYNFTPAATFDIWLNDTLLGSVSVTGTGKHPEVPVAFDSTLLQNLLLSANSVKVEGASGITNIDSFDLTYTRDFVAGGDRLLFTGDGHSNVTVSGFSGDDISVYDVSDPSHPVRIQKVLLDFDGSNRVTLAPSTAQTPYLAIGPAGEYAADQVTAYTGSDLHSSSNAYDYLVIGPAEFADAAQALISHRNSGGYSAAFIDLQAIMDEFNYGILDPEAIRTFLDHAHSHWAVGPELVTIAGGGSFDYKSNVSSGNLVPPLMVMTRYGGMASTETRFGDFSGGPLPEVFVSRIPAVTAGELSAYIDKVIEYEMSGYDSWQDEVVFVADNAEVLAGLFPQDSADLALQMPAGITPIEMYVGDGPGPHAPPYYTADAVAGLLEGAFNDGAAVVNYVGHAGLMQLADEDLFDAFDVPALSNAGRLPLVTALTCNIGFYSFPWVNSLAEALILEPVVGAIGVWGPTLLSGNTQAVNFGEALLPNLVQTNGTAFGHVATQAMQQFLKAGGDPEMIYIYDFFGDAALQLK